MSFFEAIRISISSLLANRLRSILATLGIAIGIAAVSTLLSVGQSFRTFVNQQLEGLNTDVITVESQPEFGSEAADPQLTLGDAAALGNLPNVRKVVVVYSNFGEIAAGPVVLPSQIFGVELNYFEEHELALGRALTQQEIDDRARVAVLSWSLAQQLFDDGMPVGRQVTILGLPFTVVGVTANETGGFFFNPDNIIVPLSTARNRLFPDSAFSRVQITEANLHLEDPLQIEQTEAQVRELLRQRHRLRAEDPNDFNIRNLRQFAESNNNVLVGITAFLGVIGGIALLVGGIGITNIMLVSVTERTQEIGLRKAVGARRIDIMAQFLIEAVVLSLIGGLAGLIATALLIQIGAIVIQAFFANNQLASALNLDLSAVVLALIFASVVGVVAGSYPAFRASRLSPIVALRSN